MRLQQTLRNFRNQFKAKRRHRAADKKSPRLQLESLETRLAPTVSVLNNFDSAWSGAVPPDTCGAAGPFSYIESGNTFVNIYNKSTGASIAGDGLNHFLFTVGGLTPVGGLGDATMIYDEPIGRFIVGDMDTGGVGKSALDIAVSKSSNPTALDSANWTFHQIDMSEPGESCDYPGNPGYNADAFVFTFNMSFHTEVAALSQSDLAAGGGVFVNRFELSPFSFSYRPVTMHDSAPGGPMWFVQEGSGNSINLHRIDNIFSANGLSASFNFGVNAYNSVNAPLNPDGTQITTIIDTRILKAAERFNTIVACHHIGVGSNEDDARWYKFDVSNINSPSLADQGNVGFGANTYTVYPAVDINPAGDIAMGFTKSGNDFSTDFMSTYVTGRKSGDAAGTMESAVLVRAGDSNLGSGREGDFSGINVDQDGTFWVNDEYSSGGTSHQEIAHFTLGPEAFINNGVLWVTGTNANDNVTLHQFTIFVFTFTEVDDNGVVLGVFLDGTFSSVNVEPFGGNDTVNVESTNVPLTINGGGFDTVNIGNSSDGVQGILGTINIENPPSFNTITVDDSADGTPHPNITLSTLGTNPSDSEGNTDPWGQITGLAPAPINYEYFDTTSLTVKTGTGGNTVNVLATGVTTTLVGSSGGTTVNVGNAGTLTHILGTLNIENETTSDTVNINDQNDTTFQNNATLSTVIVKGSTLGRLSGLVGVAPISPISWDYPDTAQVTINTGQAGVTLTVLGTGVPTFINGNGATNTLVGGNLLTTWHVNSANTGTLSNALASVNFADFQNLTSGSGGDGFIFANAATLSGTLNGGGGSGLSLAPYMTNLTVNITGGGLGNIPGVVTAFQGIQYLTTGLGNDSFVFGNAGSITSISSAGGTNTLDASAVNRSLSVSVYGTNAGTVPGMVFEFADIEKFIGGSKNNTYVFSNGASLAGTLNGGSATNLIDMSPYISGLTFSVTGANSGSVAGVIGSFNHVQNLLGAGGGGNVFALSPIGSLSGELDGGFGGSNLLDYSAYTTGVTVNLSLNSATALFGGVVNIQELRGGAGSDHLTGNGAGGTTFFASPGTDTITGLGSGNTLVGANTNSTWKITGSDAGTLTWGANTSTFKGVQNLTGGTGVDVFAFTALTSSVASIDGGGAPLNQGDWLDYSAYPAAVTVHLAYPPPATGTATGVTGSISNIQNVHGGNHGNTLTGDPQGNILIGGTGTNTITGGSGRSILIADKGTSAITGGSGASPNGGDILIGGYTSYDTMTAANEAALMSILAEWQSADPANTRFTDIDTGSGGGLNGTNKLNWTTTVHDNGKANTLTAQPGAVAVDWFFANEAPGHTTVFNRKPGDHTNNT